MKAGRAGAEPQESGGAPASPGVAMETQFGAPELFAGLALSPPLLAVFIPRFYSSFLFRARSPKGPSRVWGREKGMERSGGEEGKGDWDPPPTLDRPLWRGSVGWGLGIPGGGLQLQNPSRSLGNIPGCRFSRSSCSSRQE